MVVNDDVLNELKESAGDKREKKANKIKANNNVKITKINYESSNNFSIHAEVKGTNDTYFTYIEVKNGEIENLNCTCPDYESTYGTCKHIVPLTSAFFTFLFSFTAISTFSFLPTINHNHCSSLFSTPGFFFINFGSSIT